MRINTLSK